MVLSGIIRNMSEPLTLPDPLPGYGDVFLRAFTDADISMLRDLATDAYVPQTGTLPSNADEYEARAYIERQLSRLSSGKGYSFCVALRSTGNAVGQAGLWKTSPQTASAGYAIAPSFRGHGYAGRGLIALTAFAWKLPNLCRVELHIEPWNVASIRTAEVAGYRHEGSTRHARKDSAESIEMLLYASPQ